MSQEIFDGTQGSHGEQAPVMPTAVSPVRSTSQPLSQEAGLSYMDLSGPSFSSTPANQQRGSGARPFSSPSPVPSNSTSYKRTRYDDSAEVSLGLYMDSSANTSSPYDQMPDDGTQDPSSGVGTSRATCNLHSRPGWTSTSRNAWRMLWSVL